MKRNARLKSWCQDFVKVSVFSKPTKTFHEKLSLLSEKKLNEAAEIF